MPTGIDKGSAADLLGRLVACPSVNPTGLDDWVGGQYGEGAMADLLDSIVRPWGAQTRKVEFAPGRFNFIARFEGRDAGRSLMLESHADTVAVEGMTVDPFKPAIRDGRLYGRGACDTKGSMAAMLLAIRKVLDEAGQPPVTLLLVATGDEELGAGGAHNLVAEGLCVDAAVAGEPTDLKIVYAHKGVCRFNIITEGRAAHSSEPARGVNAIVHMSRIVQLIHGELAAELTHQQHPVLGSPTISVGTIRGGSQVNVVPDRCEIRVDRRMLPGETREQILADLQGRLESLKKAAPEMTYSLQQLQRYPPLQEARDGAVAGRLAEACRRVLGGAEFAGVAYATNAGVFREAGVPSVVFGPGSISQAHTADEYIELDSLLNAAGVYAELIRLY